MPLDMGLELSSAMLWMIVQKGLSRNNYAQIKHEALPIVLS